MTFILLIGLASAMKYHAGSSADRVSETDISASGSFSEHSHRAEAFPVIARMAQRQQQQNNDRKGLASEMDVNPCDSVEYSKDTTSITLHKEEESTKVGIAADGEYIGDGVRLKTVAPDLPAMEAGLRACDVVLALNGDEVSSAEDFMKAMRESVGDISLSVRKEKCASVEYSETTTSITLIKHTHDTSVGVRFYPEGLKLKAVFPNSLAMQAGLHECDEVLSINGRDFSSDTDASEATAMIRDSVGEILMIVRKKKDDGED